MRTSQFSRNMPAAEGIAKVNNPCVGICSTSTVGSIWCVGCGRYYKDVIGWNRYSESDKILAMQRVIEHRKAKKAGLVNDHLDYLTAIEFPVL